MGICFDANHNDIRGVGGDDIFKVFNEIFVNKTVVIIYKINIVTGDAVPVDVKLLVAPEAVMANVINNKNVFVVFIRGGRS
ncbi:hypothetical protein ES703_86763 [subsurface metagenome]